MGAFLVSDFSTSLLPTSVFGIRCHFFSIILTFYLPVSKISNDTISGVHGILKFHQKGQKGVSQVSKLSEGHLGLRLHSLEHAVT